MNRWFLTIAGIMGFLAVGLGAFGAHALESHFEAYPNRQPTYETAVQYQMFHVAGLIAVALLDGMKPKRTVKIAGWLFIGGTILFCGSMYILAVFQISAMGAVAPLGGVSFLAGWVLVSVNAYQLKRG